VTHIITSDAEAIETARRLATRFAAEDAWRDENRALPHTLMDELSESGLMAITVPREHGGAGVTARTVGEVFTELSAGDSNLGQIPQNHFFFVNALTHAATAAQQKFFYAEVLRGQRFANALSERNTRTVKDYAIGFERQPDGSWILDGTKYYCTGSVFAHWITVYANDAEGRTYAAWVPASHPGVTVIDDWNGMGQRTTGSGTVRFAAVRVPGEHVVPVYTIFEKTEVFGAFGQYMHACVDAGIAVAALRDGRKLIRDIARPWSARPGMRSTWRQPG
jgi:alkylation response protein AidB-like acyl-CoA dehydrogenase